MKNLIKNHFLNSSKVIRSLKEFDNKIILIVENFLNCKKKGKKILVVGNGGSSSDADHFTGELICTFSKKSRKPLSALSLSSLPAAITAWSNDFGYETFFKRQVEANGRNGDILFLLSTGGGDIKSKTSINLVLAAKEAKKRKMKIISLVGKNGGFLKKFSDINLHVNSFDTACIQEAHMSILHCICVCLDKKL